MPEIRQPSVHRTWARRAIPAGAVAVLVVAGTIVVQTNASATPIDTYRTARVTTGSVEQRLNVTGSVQKVHQTTQSFAVAGTVSSVRVSVGDAVKVGQILGTVDPAPLRSAVTDATAALAQAKATLESDQQSAATTSTTASTTATVTPAKASTKAVSTSTNPRAGSQSGPGSGAGTAQGLARAQNIASSAQRVVTADLERASAGLTQCAAFMPTGTPVPTSTTATTTTPPTTPTPTPTGPSDAAVNACLSALATAPTQQQIQRDEQALTRSQADLAKAVTLSIAAAAKSAPSVPTSSSGSTSRSGTSQSASQSTGSQASGSQATGARTGTTNQSSAARVVSDKAAITDAESTLSGAKADLGAATLRASIAGTVGSVSLVKGTSSNGENVVIVGAGPAEVTVNVPLASMAGVHVGQRANVTPPGASRSVPGAVTSISLLPTTSTSTTTSTTTSRPTTGTGAGAGQPTATTSSPTYPVVVLVPDAVPALASGGRAEVSLLIGTATNVITVPNSALTPLGNGQAIALTFKDGVATRALVKTGYAGNLTTQVTSGLSAGQQVVLADLSTALPTNTTNARRFGVGVGPGALGGAGLGGAGLGGAGLGGAGLGGAGFGGGTGSGRTGFTPGG